MSKYLLRIDSKSVFSSLSMICVFCATASWWSKLMFNFRPECLWSLSQISHMPQNIAGAQPRHTKTAAASRPHQQWTVDKCSPTQKCSMDSESTLWMYRWRRKVRTQPSLSRSRHLVLARLHRFLEVTFWQQRFMKSWAKLRKIQQRFFSYLTMILGSCFIIFFWSHYEFHHRNKDLRARHVALPRRWLRRGLRFGYLQTDPFCR